MDSVLEELFRIAITAGKKIKTEIVFSHANGSAMNSAVRMLQSRGLDFNDLKCMVIGNGDMGKLAAETLEKAGADVTVTVRQYRSGVVNIPKNCKRIDYGQRMDLLPDCDVVVSATSSPNYTLTMDHLEGVPTDHNVILIDLAVPRDIEPGVDQLENYELYDIDDFSESEISTENMNAMQEAESIFNSEKIVFRDWYESRDLIPLIQKVRDDATYDMDYRMQKILKEIPIEGEELDRLEDYVKSATGKVMTKLLFGIRSAPKKIRRTPVIYEISALALIIGGLFLIWRKIISPIIPISFIATVFVLGFIWGGLDGAIFHICAGGLMLGAFFCATDYVTSPTLPLGKLIFGIGCGVFTMLIRIFGSYPEGVSFAILLMNILTPFIDNFCQGRAFPAPKKAKGGEADGK